jgi:hypothetical protein
MSVSLSERNNLAPTGRILIKFDIWALFLKCCKENLSFIKAWKENWVLYMNILLKSDKKTGYFIWTYEYIYDISLIYS